MKILSSRTRLILFFAFSIVLFLFSCAPAYVPNVVNVPMLSNKGETQVGAYAGLSGFDFQFATAPANHFGVILNGSFMNNNSEQQSDYHKHIFAEAGAGYFNKTKRNISYEMYGGLGYGNIDVAATFLNVQTITKATLSRAFLQPDIGISTKFFGISFSPRTVFVNAVSDLNSAQEANIFFIEPVITLNAGFKKVYLQMQAGFSKNIGGTLPDWFTYEPLIFSVGIHFKFGEIGKAMPRY